ncbi:hypothetical protein BGW38_001296 [Lunasporangiospora selenospora]|uniref:LysM domain-containing protein n=1 Tax=Lunasporangiospora selenospora TaxID=979761 RepID=A0A9P6FUI4_9FUNG|nr:hypothetical protein BGW38_001296 [Lunasporangiospora selenospora]
MLKVQTPSIENLGNANGHSSPSSPTTTTTGPTNSCLNPGPSQKSEPIVYTQLERATTIINVNLRRDSRTDKGSADDAHVNNGQDLNGSSQNRSDQEGLVMAIGRGQSIETDIQVDNDPPTMVATASVATNSTTSPTRVTTTTAYFRAQTKVIGNHADSKSDPINDVHVNAVDPSSKRWQQGFQQDIMNPLQQHLQESNHQIEPTEETRQQPRHQQRPPLSNTRRASGTPSSTSSTRRASLKHLSGLGPLETERGIDSGVHLSQDLFEQMTAHPLSPSTSLPSRPTLGVKSTVLSSPPSSSASSISTDSAPLSQTSSSRENTHGRTSTETSTATSTSISTQPEPHSLEVTPPVSSKRAQSRQSVTSRPGASDGSAKSGEDQSWASNHPLVAGLTEEPGSIDEMEDTLEAAAVTPTPARMAITRSVYDPPQGPRQRGQSMSVDIRHGPLDPHHRQGDARVETNAIRRRYTSKIDEELNRTPSLTQKEDEGEGNRSLLNSTPDPSGKRVIIHQVNATDTLAGISVFYGIEVPALKRANKLWANDSIHTRKYLYIPFEECSVTRQSGVAMDESSNTVVLPQRIVHGRSGSTLVSSQQQRPPSSLNSTNSRMMSIAEGQPRHNSPDISESSAHDYTERESGHNIYNNMRRHTILEQHQQSPLIRDIPVKRTDSLPYTATPALGPLPLYGSSPRLGTWAEAKSTAVPPIRSKAMTTSLLKADSILSATTTVTHPGRQGSDSFSGTDNLPSTLVVPPSMTHEALAARFKEMDVATAGDRRTSNASREQEMRTNPIHYRHRTADLRQYAYLQQQLQQRSTTILQDGRSSGTTSSAGSRRQSIDAEAGEASSYPSFSSQTMPGLVSDAGQNERYMIIDGQEGGVETSEVLDQAKGGNDADFVVFGHHHHIYEPDILSPRLGNFEDRIQSNGVIRTCTQGITYPESDHAIETVLRRQEVVTLPAGMLSYFPSPEHSRKLETPESISKIQSRMEGAPYPFDSGSVSSSASSSSPGGSRQDRTRARARRPLGEGTFQPPTGGSIMTGTPSTESRVPPSPTSPTARGAYSKAVRVNSSTYSTKTLSLMGESLVDEILGAVRGPLQIARRMYNISMFGFGFGPLGSKDKDDDDTGEDPEYGRVDGLFRRGSTSGTRSRVRVGSIGRREGIRYSGSAIELSQTTMATATIDFTSVTTSSSTLPTTTSWHPGGGLVRVAFSDENPSKATPGQEGTSNPERERGGSVRRQGSSGGKKTGSSGGGGGHGRVSSSGSMGSTRKRSLRSSHPVNHSALMALVNEMEKDKKKQETEKQYEKDGIEVEEGADAGEQSRTMEKRQTIVVAGTDPLSIPRSV